MGFARGGSNPPLVIDERENDQFSIKIHLFSSNFGHFWPIRKLWCKVKLRFLVWKVRCYWLLQLSSSVWHGQSRSAVHWSYFHTSSWFDIRSLQKILLPIHVSLLLQHTMFVEQRWEGRIDMHNVCKSTHRLPVANAWWVIAPILRSKLNVTT